MCDVSVYYRCNCMRLLHVSQQGIYQRQVILIVTKLNNELWQSTKSYVERKICKYEVCKDQPILINATNESATLRLYWGHGERMKNLTMHDGFRRPHKNVFSWTDYRRRNKSLQLILPRFINMANCSTWSHSWPVHATGPNTWSTDLENKARRW